MTFHMLLKAAAKTCGRIDVGHCTCKQSHGADIHHVHTHKHTWFKHAYVRLDALSNKPTLKANFNLD